MAYPHLSLIRGGKKPGRRIGSVIVRVATAESRRQLVTDVMVFEEDTNLIMTIDESVHHREEHPIRLFTGALRARRQVPGSLVVNGKSWYAVVLDIDQEPNCQPGWIAPAYNQVFERIERDGIRSAAVHLLGCINGGVAMEEGMSYCLEALIRQKFTQFQDMTVLVPERSVSGAREFLSEY